MMKPALVALAVLGAGPALAQDAGWKYKATFYGWFPGIDSTVDTRFGTVESDVSSSDVLSNLDMAFMGTFAAQNGRWGFAGDLLYSDISPSQATPLPFYGEITVDVKLTAISGYALYRVSQDLDVQVDLGVGLRYFDTTLDVALSPGLRPAASQSVSGSWTDPLIAARLAIALNDDWFLAGFADWGGTGSGDETWQVYAGVGYNFNEHWSSQVGYRYMDISKNIDGNNVSLGMSGLVLAGTYSF